MLITGATGCGKSFLACALANAVLRQGHTAVYLRTPRLADDLARGRAHGRYVRILAGLARVSLLVLDDFLLNPAPVEVCRDLLEGRPVTRREAKTLAAALAVPDEVRRRARAHSAATHRAQARPWAFRSLYLRAWPAVVL